MKKNTLSTMLFILAIGALASCNGMSKPAENNADSLAVDSPSSTISDEKMEVQSTSPTMDVEKYWSQFQEMYEEGDLDDVHYPLTKYAFIDIDEDGKDEVWVRTADDEDGALFCFDDEEEPQLVITETEGKRLSVAKGWVGNGYPAGGPSYINHYVVLKDSHVECDFTDFQVYENHEYYLRDTEITEAEAKKIKDGIKSMGEGKAVTPEWITISNN